MLISSGVKAGASLVLKPGGVADSDPDRRELENVIDLAVSSGASTNLPGHGTAAKGPENLKNTHKMLTNFQEKLKKGKSWIQANI